MTGWAELAPQIAVAIAIVAVALLLLRQLTSMAKSMTRPTANGKRESRIEAMDDTIADHGKLLVSHGKMHRKQFKAMSILRDGQREILEYLTDGPSTTDDIPLDIDAADTGEYQAYTGDDAS
jgi:hypothetical protein